MTGSVIDLEQHDESGDQSLSERDADDFALMEDEARRLDALYDLRVEASELLGQMAWMYETRDEIVRAAAAAECERDRAAHAASVRVAWMAWTKETDEVRQSTLGAFRAGADWAQRK